MAIDNVFSSKKSKHFYKLVSEDYTTQSKDRMMAMVIDSHKQQENLKTGMSRAIINSKKNI